MEYQSFAKINLYLDVLDRRPDGYTNIETIFQTVSLCDHLRIEPGDRELVLQCSMPGLETDNSNLVMKAALALRHATGCEQGATMTLDKHIPVAAGLAGGSGNCAAALAGLNVLWGLGLSLEELREIAVGLGSDVPYCLTGGTVAATGRGEILTPLRPIAKAWFVLVHPPFHVSTAAVYGSPDLARNTETPNRVGTPRFRSVVTGMKEDRMPEVVFNRMESAAFVMHPELAEVKQLLLDRGCLAAAMSGSGPTVFGLCRSEAQARGLVEDGLPYPSSVVHSVDTGVRLVK
ncbi:MAG: 4-diphosphocytidyl-2-C-methyl-D-erythritol kinase [Candidatus Hydrogenedentota bacterium]